MLPQQLGGGKKTTVLVLSGVLTFVKFVAPMFEDVQRHVAGLIRGKILVGYGLWNFLSVSVFAVIQTVAT